MTGHVRQDKKTKKYMYTIELGYDRNGKRKRKIKRGFNSPREAKSAMTMAMAEMLSVGSVDPTEGEPSNSVTSTETNDQRNELTVGEYLDYWLKTYVKTNTAYNTFVGYERMIRVHLKPALGHILLSKLTVRDIQSYYSSKVKTENILDDDENDGLSAQTVKHHHRLLCKALNDAVDWEYIEKNVAQKAKAPKVEKIKITTYTANELNMLFENIKDSEIYYPIVFVAAHTGARLGELRALSWDDVDFKNSKIYFRKTAYEVKGQGVKIKNTTKSGKERAVVMGAKLQKFLENHKDKSNHKKEILGNSFNPENLVFTNSKGNYFDVRDLYRAYKKAIKSAKLPDGRFHDLRHSHATILLQNNVHPKIVSERLGHSKISITLDTYSHVLPSLQDGAADTFDSAFQ